MEMRPVSVLGRLPETGINPTDYAEEIKEVSIHNSAWPHGSESRRHFGGYQR